MERPVAQPHSLLSMTWPIFIELLLQLLVGNVDQVMLSQYNTTAVAAVGNANQVITILILTFSVISLAATILILMNLFVSLVLAGMVYFGGGAILAWMQIPAELLPEARSYLLITGLSLPFQALMLTFSAFLRAHARMLVIMLSTGVINLINIVGNAILIGGMGPVPSLGAAGAAISTTLCRIAGMGMMIAAFYANVRGEKIRLSLLKPFPKDLLLRLLGIGLPSGGESLSYNLSQMTSLVFVNTLGAYVVTTRMYANMLAQVCYTLIQAVSQAGQILVGYHIGARDFDGADRENRHILKTFVPVTVGITLVLWLFARPIYGFLSKDPQIVALGAQVMLVEVFLEIGRSFNIVLVRNLQAVGDVKYPVAVGIASQWIIAVGLAWFLGIHQGMGLVGMWIAFAIDENVRACEGGILNGNRKKGFRFSYNLKCSQNMVESPLSTAYYRG